MCPYLSSWLDMRSNRLCTCSVLRVVGFDIVEIAPREVDIISEFAMAKLCYKFLGYLNTNNHI
jgi:arginase family enzyme